MSIETKENKLKSIFQAYANAADCIIYIDYEMLKFEKLQAKGFWDKTLPVEGSLETLKAVLFYQDKNGSTVSEEKYTPFLNSKMDMEEDKQGNLFRIIDGVEHKFDYFTVNIDEKKSAIIIKEYFHTIFS